MGIRLLEVLCQGIEQMMSRRAIQEKLYKKMGKINNAHVHEG